MKFESYILRCIFILCTTFLLTSYSMEYIAKITSHNDIINSFGPFTSTKPYWDTIGPIPEVGKIITNIHTMRKIKPLFVFSKELNVGVMEGISVGFFRVFSEMFSYVGDLEDYFTEEKLLILKKLIKQTFEDGRSYCVTISGNRSEVYDKVLYYLYNGPTTYECLLSTLDGMYNTLKENHGQLTCWDDCELFYKNIIQRYLKYVCQEISNDQLHPSYLECCKEFVSHYANNLILGNISIEKILDFNIIESCVNPDPNRLYRELNDVNFGKIGFQCGDFPELSNNSDGNEKHLTLISISAADRIKLDNILYDAECDCKSNNFIYFFDNTTMLGFLLSTMISILLLYFRF